MFCSQRLYFHKMKTSLSQQVSKNNTFNAVAQARFLKLWCWEKNTNEFPLNECSLEQNTLPFHALTNATFIYLIHMANFNRGRHKWVRRYLLSNIFHFQHFKMQIHFSGNSFALDMYIYWDAFKAFNQWIQVYIIDCPQNVAMNHFVNHFWFWID